METSQGAKPGGREMRIGGHIVRVEAPDVFYVALLGDVAPHESAAILDAQEQVAKSTERFVVLVDFSRMGTFAPEERQLGVERNRAMPNFAALAGVGASFRLRVMLTLITKALALTRRAALPLSFFDAEEDARTWLETYRGGAGKSAAP